MSGEATPSILTDDSPGLEHIELTKQEIVNGLGQLDNNKESRPELIV